MAYATVDYSLPLDTAEINKLITNVNLGTDRVYYSAETAGPLTLNDGASPLSLVSYNLAYNNLPEMVIVTGSVSFSATKATNINIFLTRNGSKVGSYGSLTVTGGLQFPFCVIMPLFTPGGSGTNAYIVKAELANATLGSVATFAHVAVTHWQI